MRSRHFPFLSLAVVILAGPWTLAFSETVVFENVNVIPMDRERILRNHTVLVRDERIAEMGPASSLRVPSDAQKIDASGKYLMPGFAEMHGHLPRPDTPPEIIDRVLFLFVANGVTTVRGMLGHPSHLDLRREIEEGKRFGPTLYLAGPGFGGPDLTPEMAQQRVREQKAAGYDLLKVQERLTPETYDAMAATARDVGIPFGGHVPNDVGLLRALEAGQSSIDHLDNYLEALEADNSPLRKADPRTRAQQLPLHIDEDKIPELVKATRNAKAAVVPTMALWETFNSDQSADSMAKREELKHAPREWVDQWIERKSSRNVNAEAGRRVIAVRKKLLKALSDAGVPIVFGTDAPQVFSVPGFSIHREMPIMLSAGMTPYQVLVSGTRNVGEYFSSSEFGTVEVGKRADLILLERNPLENITNMARRAGVMLRGKWIPESEIQAKLAEFARASATHD